MKKWFSRIWCLLNVLFMLWIAISWVDIVWDNYLPNPVHSEYNAFVMLVKYTGNK